MKHLISIIAAACLTASLVATDAVTVDATGKTTFTGTVAGPNLLATAGPVAITGTYDIGATLGAAAAGKFFQISGNTANYTVTLPSVSIGTGVVLGFNVAPWGSATKQYTIVAASTENIDGRITPAGLVLIQSNSLLLISTSLGWVSLTKKVDTEWVSSGPISIGAVTTPPGKPSSGIVIDQLFWRRVGDSVALRYEYAETVAGTAGNGMYLFGLPPGFSADLTKVQAGLNTGVATTSSALGSGYITNWVSASGITTTALYDTTRVVAWATASNGTTLISSSWYSLAFPYSWRLNAVIPIVGW